MITFARICGRPLIALTSVALQVCVAAVTRAQTQPAATQPAAATVVVPATITAYYWADLYAKDSGYVSDVKADIGDHVKKGQLLAVIDDPELVFQLGGAEATLVAKQEMMKASEASIAQAQALIEISRKQLAGFDAEQKLAAATLKRQEALFADKAATSQQIDEMRARAQVSEAAVEVGKAKLAGAEVDLRAAEANRSVAAAQVRIAAAEVQRFRALVGYTQIVAPFDGVITRRQVNPGDLAQAAATNRTTPLFTCQKVDVVRICCDIPEASAAGVRAGVPAEIRLLSGAKEPLHGAVTRISGALDPATRTLRAEIELPNPTESLRPGMYAEVTLHLGNER